MEIRTDSDSINVQLTRGEFIGGLLSLVAAGGLSAGVISLAHSHYMKQRETDLALIGKYNAIKDSIDVSSENRYSSAVSEWVYLAANYLDAFSADGASISNPDSIDELLLRGVVLIERGIGNSYAGTFVKYSPLIGEKLSGLNISRSMLVREGVAENSYWLKRKIDDTHRRIQLYLEQYIDGTKYRQA